MFSNAEVAATTTTNNITPSHPTPDSSMNEGGSCGGADVVNKLNFTDLVYWKDIRITGAVFFSSFVFLLSLALFSVLSVVSYILLVTLTITFTYRIYKNIISAIRKTGETSPFKKYLELDIGLNESNAHKATHVTTTYLSYFLEELRNLLLINDLVDSLQFGLVLWLLTYIGSWFNGMTLIILADVGIFTIPKFYDVYQTQINQYWNTLQNKFKDVLNMIKEKLKQIEFPSKKKLQ